jgi:hypothetical protein
MENTATFKMVLCGDGGTVSGMLNLLVFGLIFF